MNRAWIVFLNVIPYRSIISSTLTIFPSQSLSIFLSFDRRSLHFWFNTMIVNNVKQFTHTLLEYSFIFPSSPPHQNIILNVFAYNLYTIPLLGFVSCCLFLIILFLFCFLTVFHCKYEFWFCHFFYTIISFISLFTNLRFPLYMYSG